MTLATLIVSSVTLSLVLLLHGSEYKRRTAELVWERFHGTGSR